MDNWEISQDTFLDLDGLVTAAKLGMVAGSIDVVSTDGVARVEIGSVSGNATLDLSPAPGSSVSAKSVSGDVLMRTPLEAYASVELASVSGALHTSGDTPFDVRRGPGSNRAWFLDGAGTASFSGKTVSGAITLIDHL